MQQTSQDILRNQLVLEGTRIGIWDWNIQTGETYFNERWAEIVGYRLDELKPISIETWMKLAHPDDLEESNRLLELHFKGESEYYDFETRMRHKDGHWVWVHDRGKVFEWDESGAPLRMCGSHMEITRQKEKEQQLSAANHKLKTILNILDVGISVTDEQGQIIDCNKASEKLLGITKEEHLSRSYSGKEWKIIRKDHTTMPPEEYASTQALNTGKAVNGVEMGIVKEDDEITWLSVNAQPIELPGYGVMIAYIDITRIINYQKELEAAHNTKNKLFSVMGHDLRNPFSSISGFLELADMDLKEKKYDQMEETLNMIKQANQEGTDLLGSLYNWSRFESGTKSYRPEATTLNHILDQALSTLRSASEKKKISILLPKDSDISLRTDVFMMSTVFRNLLSNAIKFSHTGGKVEISYHEEGNSVRVDVQDSGVGISEEEVPGLFDPQNLRSKDGTNGEKGTGLGLSLCKEYITLCGGQIKVESNKGQGSCFSFSLPR